MTAFPMPRPTSMVRALLGLMDRASLPVHGDHPALWPCRSLCLMQHTACAVVFMGRTEAMPACVLLCYEGQEVQCFRSIFSLSLK